LLKGAKTLTRYLVLNLGNVLLKLCVDVLFEANFYKYLLDLSFFFFFWFVGVCCLILPGGGGGLGCFLFVLFSVFGVFFAGVSASESIFDLFFQML